jgi:TolC family type I secretion outer membrane protein
MRAGLCAGVIGVGTVLLVGPASAVTLHEALALAYQGNPTLGAQRAFVRSVDENVPQALSGWRPTISLSGSVGKSYSRVQNVPDRDTAPASAAVQLTQPLYRGGRTVASTEQAEKQVLAAREGLRAVEQQVLLSGVTAYMDVLRDQARVQLTSNNVEVLQRQLEASQDRFDVGEVTRTDVAQSQARLARAISERSAAEGFLEQSRATYLRVIGQPASDLVAAPLPPTMPETLEEAIALATERNPTLAQSRYNEEAQGHAVRVATGNLLPTVSLVGSASRADDLSGDDTLSTTVTGSESLTAQVTVPLYQSGSVSSQIRQAKQTRNQRRIEIEETRRQVEEATIQAWETLIAARQVIVATREQVEANQIALDGVIQENQVGSRTTLDVLDAEQELLDSQVTLVIAERDEYVAIYSLLAAIGALTAEQLGLDVSLYDPTQHYRAVRDKWWGWEIEDEGR